MADEKKDQKVLKPHGSRDYLVHLYKIFFPDCEIEEIDKKGTALLYKELIGHKGELEDFLKSLWPYSGRKGFVAFTLDGVDSLSYITDKYKSFLGSEEDFIKSESLSYKFGETPDNEDKLVQFLRYRFAKDQFRIEGTFPRQFIALDKLERIKYVLKYHRFSLMIYDDPVLVVCDLSQVNDAEKAMDLVCHRQIFGEVSVQSKRLLLSERDVVMLMDKSEYPCVMVRGPHVGDEYGTVEINAKPLKKLPSADTSEEKPTEKQAKQDLVLAQMLNYANERRRYECTITHDRYGYVEHVVFDVAFFNTHVKVTFSKTTSTKAIGHVFRILC